MINCELMINDGLIKHYFKIVNIYSCVLPLMGPFH